MKLLWLIYKFIFKRLARLEPWLIYTSIGLLVILGFTTPLTSFVLKKIIETIEYCFDSTLSSYHSGFLIFFCTLYLMLIGLREIASICRSTLFHLIGLELTFDIQAQILEKIKKISYKTFFTQKFQDLYSNVLKNSSTECFKLATTTVNLLVAIIEAVSVMVILICFKLEIVLILTLCSFPALLIKCKTQNEFIDTCNANTKLERKNSYWFNVLTDKTYLKEIRLFDLENKFCQKRKFNFDNILLNWKTFGKREAKKIILSQVISSLGILISVCYIIHITLNKLIGISDFVFYSGIILSFQAACGQFVFQMSESYKSTLFIKQLFEFLALDENITKTLLSSIKVKKHKCYTIEFHDVTFRYPECQKNALHNVNFKIKSGEKVSIVGENGCGKSTLINLLLRHYVPTSGYISLNGINIQKYDLVEYRKMFSGIYQDFQKFAVPVNEFIAFGNKSHVHDFKKLKLATQKTLINNLLENLPQKYETLLTQLFEPNGLELSGGQWQRLAVSRAFFSDAPILIFDEPTSALDAISEAKIYKELSKIKNKLTILISHRMYTLKHSDKIIYMANGTIVNIGKHDELLEKCDGYKRLYTTQCEH